MYINCLYCDSQLAEKVEADKENDEVVKREVGSDVFGVV